jgi:hypothetical protein
MNYQNFKNKWLGKGIDYDGAYGFQCFDVINQYILETTGQKPYIRLDWADEIFKRPNDIIPAGVNYTVIKNNETPNNFPIEGDIIVWDKAKWNGNGGHTAIVDNANSDRSLVLQQDGFKNWQGCQLVEWSFWTYTPLGWIRLNTTPTPQPPADNRFYTVQQGGWRSQVIQEIINAGIWSGTWQENEPKFLELNGLPPQGGYTAGMQVRIAPDPQVDSIKVSEPAPIQPQPEVQPAQPTMSTISVEKPIIFTDPVQPQLPEPELIKETTATITMTTDSQPKKEFEKWNWNTFFVGIVSGKNFLANSTFFLGLAGIYAFYNQNQEEINLAIGLASQAVSMIFVLVRKYQDQQKQQRYESAKKA